MHQCEINIKILYATISLAKQWVNNTSRQQITPTYYPHNIYIHII